MTRSAQDRPTCFVYLPATYDGRGVPEICMSLVAGFAAEDLDTVVLVPRTRAPVPPGVRVRQTLPFPLRYLPWRYVHRQAIRSLDRALLKALRGAAGRPAVAYFWPSYLMAPSVELLRRVQSLGVPIVREMVNTACSTSGPILDAAYDNHGLPRLHNVSTELISHERAELPIYDRIFAVAPEVEASLLRMGIAADRVVPASYGWKRARFAGDGVASRNPGTGIRAVFVGIVGVRKGVPELLDAWEQAGVEGELILVGAIEPAIADRVERAVAGGKVHRVGFVDDVGDFYRSADFFVFPSHEEGAPQVTYEAAACGLPVITTPMGAARLVETGKTGIVVPPGDVDALAAAIRELAGSPELRGRLGAAARAEAETFEYTVVGRKRAVDLRGIVTRESW